MVVPYFWLFSASDMWANINTGSNHLRKNTVEKETVITGDNQAPVTQKATDHIDEELRLAIFKTLKLSQIFFRILLEFQNEDLKDIARGGGYSL